MKHKIALIKSKVRMHVNALLLSSYIMFGGDIPLPRAMVIPLFYMALVGRNVFGAIAKLLTVLKVLRFLRLTGAFIPFGMLVSATAFSYRVCYAAMIVEVKHHKLKL